MWSEVDRYIADKLIRDDSGAAHDHAVSPPQGALLELLARAIGARAILEIGTLEGYSTLWLARALPPDGRLVTLEIDPDRAARAREALGDRAEVITGPALERGGAGAAPLAAGHADRGRQRDPRRGRDRPRRSRPVGPRRALFDALADEPHLATAMQTVGAKGYDGFALVLVGG